MPLHPRIQCRIEPRSVGWWLDFPSDPQAGLLLTTEGEKCEFARDCGIELLPEDLSAAWFFTQISECPQYWYEKAATFSSRTTPF